MAEKPESCPTCNRYTHKGLQQLAVEFRSRPISGMDMSRPMSELLQEVRADIRRAREKLSDLEMGFTGMSERVRPAIGLLTCGLVALHYEMEKVKSNEERWKAEDAANKAEGSGK